MNDNNPREESSFNAAMQLATPEARAALLRQACAGDDQLRQRVKALLQAAQPTKGFLDHSATAATETRRHCFVVEPVRGINVKD